MICVTTLPSKPCWPGTAPESILRPECPLLTTFLGHGHVADTYWYLSATPELLRLATQRLEHMKGGAKE